MNLWLLKKRLQFGVNRPFMMWTDLFINTVVIIIGDDSKTASFVFIQFRAHSHCAESS